MYLVLSTPHFVYNFEKRGRMKCTFPMSFVISFKTVTRKPDNSVYFRISFLYSTGKIFFSRSHSLLSKLRISALQHGNICKVNNFCRRKQIMNNYTISDNPF